MVWVLVHCLINNVQGKYANTGRVVGQVVFNY